MIKPRVNIDLEVGVAMRFMRYDTLYQIIDETHPIYMDNIVVRYTNEVVVSLVWGQEKGVWTSAHRSDIIVKQLPINSTITLTQGG